MVRHLQLVIAAFIGLAPSLGAQNKAAPNSPDSSKNGKAQIVGVVGDSLNRRYLSGADVVIEGASATLETDSLGRFKIENLPPGTYQVGVFHPLLDTLGLALSTKPFHVGPDSVGFVALAVPSAATIISRSCPVRAGAMGNSAVIGHVNDPETLQPVPRAEVSIAWNDIEISKAVGVRRTPRLIRDTTDGSGAFKICGLPSSMHATLKAQRGSAVTADIPISLGDNPTELLGRILLLSPADSATKVGSAVVSGLVVLEGSTTKTGSRVELVGTDIVAVTNDKGEFTLRNLPSGSRILLARHLGFGAETVPVDLSSHHEARVTINLPRFVATMDPVLVVARRSAALDKVGFNQRRKSGFGYYLGPDRLEHMHASLLTDILRLVPGLRVTYGPEGEVVTSSRGFTGGSCVQYYLDDMPFREMTPGEINHFVTGGEVVAVEVYQGATTPAQFMSASSYGCTTIVLWTRFKIRG
jgi:Carboxypeptidase regulatory-like domain